MFNGTGIRILEAAWYVVKVQGKRHSPLVVSKDNDGEREGVKESGRRTEGNGKVEIGVFFIIPPKNPGPIFLIKKKRKPFF